MAGSEDAAGNTPINVSILTRTADPELRGAGMRSATPAIDPAATHMERGTCEEDGGRLGRGCAARELECPCAASALAGSGPSQRHVAII